MIYSQASVNRHIDHDVRGIRSRWYSQLKKIVSRSKLVSRDLYSPTQQSVPPNNALKLQITFFLNAKQRLVPNGISIRRDLYFNYYKDY